MQLKEYFHHYIKELKPIYGADEAHAISQMIFEHFAKASKTDILINPHRIIEHATEELLISALFQLKAHVPVQQVVGHCWFAGLSFTVSPAVLVPRPETEELVHMVCDFISKNNLTTVLDIGTGSGCIAISIQHLLRNTKVTAIDISKEALAIAQKNVRDNNAAINLKQLNFLEEFQWDQLGSFDVIISNPPYIPFSEKETMSKNVIDHEPHLALFVADEDHLVFYKKIARFAQKHLNENGVIFLETHESYANEVALCLNQSGFEAEVKKDFFEKERMLVAIRYR